MLDGLLKMLVALCKQVLIGDDDCVILEVLDVTSCDVMDVAIHFIDI